MPAPNSSLSSLLSLLWPGCAVCLMCVHSVDAEDATAAAGRTTTDRAITRLTTDGWLKQRPAWSPDGHRLVFARHRGSTIYLFVRSADGSQERRLTDRTDPEYDAAWSPDGKQLAFSYVKTSPNQGDLEVYLIDADGKNLTPFAVTDGKLSHEESPAWSADGRWIAYTSTRHGNREIYAARADGSETKRLTSDAALDMHPAFAPNGTRLVFATNRWGDLELAAVDLVSGKIQRLTDSPGLDDYPAFSPDGRRIVFTSNREGNMEIYVIDAKGGHPQNISNHEAIDNFPTWSPDGNITFVSNRDGGFDIYTIRVEKEP